MNQRWRKITAGLGSALLVLAASLPAAPPASAADEVPVSIKPDVIILNAQGDAEEVAAQIVLHMAWGHSIQSFDISLLFDGLHVADAFALVYQYSDGLYSASFDKNELLQNQDVIDMGNSIVTARVEGQITTADGTGGIVVVMEFFGFDDVEIVLPDPCWGDFDEDGDVDGKGLADFLARDNWTPQLLETLAGEFGRDDCPLPANPQ